MRKEPPSCVDLFSAVERAVLNSRVLRTEHHARPQEPGYVLTGTWSPRPATGAGLRWDDSLTRLFKPIVAADRGSRGWETLALYDLRLIRG